MTKSRVWTRISKPTQREPGHDSLSVIDISPAGRTSHHRDDPADELRRPGPPTNLAVTPAGDVALVANSIEPVIQGWGHRLEPDNKVFVVDLKANPPNVIGTVTCRQTALGFGDQSKGRPRPRRQSRRRHDLGPGGQRQGHRRHPRPFRSGPPSTWYPPSPARPGRQRTRSRSSRPGTRWRSCRSTATR